MQKQTHNLNNPNLNQPNNTNANIDTALQGLMDFLQKHQPWQGFTPIAKSNDLKAILIFTNNQATHDQVSHFFQGNLQFDNFPIQIQPLGFIPTTNTHSTHNSPTNSTPTPATNSTNSPVNAPATNTPAPTPPTMDPAQPNPCRHTHKNNTNAPIEFPTELLNFTGSDTKTLPWSTLLELPYRRELPSNILSNAKQQIEAIDSYRRNKGISTRHISQEIGEAFNNPATQSNRQLYGRLNDAKVFPLLKDHTNFVEQLCHVLNIQTPPCIISPTEITNHNYASINSLCQHTQALISAKKRDKFTRHAISQLLKTNSLSIHTIHQLSQPVEFPQWAPLIPHAIAFNQYHLRATQSADPDQQLTANTTSDTQPNAKPTSDTQPCTNSCIDHAQPTNTTPTNANPSQPIKHTNTLNAIWENINANDLTAPNKQAYLRDNIPHMNLPFNEETGYPIPTQDSQTISIKQLTQLPSDLKVNPAFLFHNFNDFWTDIQNIARNSQSTINAIWNKSKKIYSKKHGGSFSCGTAYSILQPKDSNEKDSSLYKHLPTHWAQVHAIAMALKPNATLSLKYPWLLHIKSMNHIHNLSNRFLKLQHKSLSSRAIFLAQQTNCSYSQAIHRLQDGHAIRTDLWLPLEQVTYQHIQNQIATNPNVTNIPDTNPINPTQPTTTCNQPPSTPSHDFIQAHTQLSNIKTLMAPTETLCVPGHTHSSHVFQTTLNILKKPYNQFIAEQHPDSLDVQVFGPLKQNDHAISFNSYVNSTSIEFIQKAIPTNSPKHSTQILNSIQILVDIEDLFAKIGVKQTILDDLGSYSWVERCQNYTFNGRDIYTININDLDKLLKEAQASLDFEYLGLLLLQIKSIQQLAKLSIHQAILNHIQPNHAKPQTNITTQPHNDHANIQAKPNKPTTKPTPSTPPKEQVELQVNAILQQKEQLKLQLHPIAQLPNPYRRNTLVTIMRTIHSSKPFRAPGANSHTEREGWRALYQAFETKHGVSPYDLIPSESDLKPLDAIVETTERTQQAFDIIVDLWGTLIAQGKQAV